jgi:hypothetical protein
MVVKRMSKVWGSANSILLTSLIFKYGGRKFEVAFLSRFLNHRLNGLGLIEAANGR